MGFKSLFINSDEPEVSKPKITEVKHEINKFPVMDSQINDIFSNGTSTGFPSATQTAAPVVLNNQASSEHINQFVEMYHRGFDGLNQPSYDFYEFYKAIVDSGGIDNPQMYVMAMTMGTSMDKSNTKARLLSQADFYVNEINKVYNQYVSTGNSKRQDLITQKASEAQSLESELTNLRGQLEAIANQIKSKEGNLSTIDGKYTPLIGELDSKLRANDFAKETIVASIQKVKSGITNNLK
jgi:hypothetical protein